jgi:hypothetical protein
MTLLAEARFRFAVERSGRRQPELDCLVVVSDVYGLDSARTTQRSDQNDEQISSLLSLLALVFPQYVLFCFTVQTLRVDSDPVQPAGRGGACESVDGCRCAVAALREPCRACAHGQSCMRDLLSASVVCDGLTVCVSWSSCWRSFRCWCCGRRAGTPPLRPFCTYCCRTASIGDQRFRFVERFAIACVRL